MKNEIIFVHERWGKVPHRLCLSLSLSLRITSEGAEKGGNENEKGGNEKDK